jgi:hypothetical protein
MADNSRQAVTCSRYFLEPANVTHRRYEALRAYFVEGLPSAEAAKRFGYTPGSFRVLTHQFRQNPTREFFLPSAREARPHGKQNRLRDQVLGLRKQNFSIGDISRALSREGKPISPAAVAEILQAEGFAKLPRRLDEERPESPRPTIAAQPVSAWRRIELEAVSRAYRTPRILDQKITLPDYEGPVRQLVVTELGHEEPTLLLTNQLTRSPAKLIGRYAQRMLIENGIADGIDFFHMDALSSAVALKVNCDLQLTLMASGL